MLQTSFNAFITQLMRNPLLNTHAQTLHSNLQLFPGRRDSGWESKPGQVQALLLAKQLLFIMHTGTLNRHTFSAFVRGAMEGPLQPHNNTVGWVGWETAASLPFPPYSHFPFPHCRNSEEQHPKACRRGMKWSFPKVRQPPVPASQKGFYAVHTFPRGRNFLTSPSGT